jgi:diguanylate cyclase (GGDEF)-like protein/PAS domain S-box-containing protein
LVRVTADPRRDPVVGSVRAAVPRSGESQLLRILDDLPLAVMLRAQDGSLLHLNPGGVRFIERLGVDVDAVMASPSSLLDHVEVIDADGRPISAEHLPVVSALRDTSPRDATLGYALADGTRAWYAVRAAPVLLEDGTIGTVVTLDDVTDQHEARHRVAVAERSLRLTFENAPIGMAVLSPDGDVLDVNPALCELLGHDRAALLSDGWATVVAPEDRAAARLQLARWWSGTGDRHLIDGRFLQGSGRTLSTQVSVALVRDDDGAPIHLIAQVVDLTERRELERELRAAAVQDPLTGLSNRRALGEHLAAALRQQERDGGSIGMLFVDLDDFKQVNDRHGHDVGDRVLIEVGRRLVAAAREVDRVCRLGGDEFVVLCAPLEGPDGLAEMVDRITALPVLTVVADDGPVRVHASVGATVVVPGDDLDGALRRADRAMYRAKLEA